MTRFGVAFLIAVPLLAGCGHSENRHLKRVAQRDELVGSYRGTRLAMEGLKYAGFRKHLDPSEHRLELRDDGTCEVETVVNPFHAGVDGGGQWIPRDSSCQWEFRPGGPHQDVAISVVLGSETKHMSFFLDEVHGHLLLWNYAGDPDAWKYMELEKVTAIAG